MSKQGIISWNCKGRKGWGDYNNLYMPSQFWNYFSTNIQFFSSFVYILVWNWMQYGFVVHQDGGFINPIPAGILENQDMLGGGSIWPPPHQHILCLMSKYDKWYIIGKLLCSTFRICKKICKFAKIEFFIAKSSYILKMFAKKKLSKKGKIIHFWKALHHAISNMQKVLQNFE